MRPVRKIFTLPMISLLKKLDLYSSYSLRTSGPLKDDGWFRSFKEESSEDAAGNPIPWLTYPAIEFIQRRINKEMSVFEYGCGGSTLWWASRVKEVISIEHDKDWYQRILPTIPNNVMLEYVELEYGGKYSQQIFKYKCRFDIVVIDGRDRVNCGLNAINALKPGGVIVWDNSDQEEYEQGYQFLLNNGFKKIEFVGLAPIVNWKAETGIFYRQDNCLGL
jgi:precorrin-6B methylase 2